jgi:guanine nucleotide-binding protein G(I)/G(S)/G(T) subunit beta-1
MVWNALTENKVSAIPLKSAWVMTCGFEQTEQKFVACGGLDNVCSIFNLSNPSVSRASQELTGHDGYLSCCRFLSNTDILTASGDSTCVLWDVERNEQKMSFSDHAGDVMSVSLSPEEPNMFCSGACDSTVRVWDIRSGECTHIFSGHESDINAVDFFPSGMAVGSGSDDSSCRLFDLRARGTLNVYAIEKVACGVTSVAWSKSGRLLFAGYDDNVCYAWETMSGESEHHSLSGHTNRVSCLGVNSTGQALAMGSWDTSLSIWS